MSTVTQIQSISFAQWVGQRRRYLMLSAGIALLQFLVFKVLYPYPNFLPDSFSYIEAAMEGRHINTWPIGYSRFLWLFGFLTRSHWGLVLFQYVLLQVAILYFIFSVAYFLKPGKWQFRVWLFACIMNPLLLHVCNFVSSDALFAALSLIWFTQIIWISYKPELKLLLLHALVLLLVFTVRYNAMYYPVISIAVVIITNMPRWIRWIAIASILLLLGVFIGYTQVHYEKETGKVQFPPFGGWQLASNALFAYAHVSASQRTAKPFKFTTLQVITDRHMDSMQQLSNRPDAALGIYYLWNPRSPLQEFKHVWWGNDSSSGFKRWTLTAPIYKEYGSYIIQQYPGAFMKHYILPNLIHYYVPPPEFLASYNMGKDTVGQTAVTWFGLETNKVSNNTGGTGIRIGDYYPLVLALINLLFVLGFIGFLLLNGLDNSRESVKKIYGWFWVVWFCNMGFSVLASPIVLRYQVFPMLMTQTFMFWLIAHLVEATRTVSIPLIMQKNIKSPVI